jgi:hypothetical protein
MFVLRISMGLELKVLRVMLKLLAIRYREKSRGKMDLPVTALLRAPLSF